MMAMTAAMAVVMSIPSEIFVAVEVFVSVMVSMEGGIFKDALLHGTECFDAFGNRRVGGKKIEGAAFQGIGDK